MRTSLLFSTDLTLHLPNGVDWTFDVGAVAGTMGAIVALLVVAAIVIRLAHVFVGGMARASTEVVDGIGRDLAGDPVWGPRIPRGAAR
jgi:hypothetical protein